MVYMYDINTTYIFPEALTMVVKALLKFLYSPFMIFAIFFTFFLVLFSFSIPDLILGNCISIIMQQM